jgi:hypothetical protein
VTLLSTDSVLDVENKWVKKTIRSKGIEIFFLRVGFALNYAPPYYWV